MAYVYRHIRLDKNQPFYIGIGSDISYKRAYEKTRRNKIWNDIVTKSDYQVEILFDDLSWDKACEKEIEFINLYGRKNKGNGTLANLTDGGEGALNRIYKTKDETKLKLRNAHIGKTHSKETKEKFSIIRKGKPLSDKHINNLKISAKKRDYKAQGLKCADKIRESMNVSNIIIYKNDIYIGEYKNRKICKDILGVSKTTFYNILRSENKVYKEFKLIIK